jgi:hypothetical protein
VAQVTPAALAFGDQAVNTASEIQKVTVTNVGTVDLIVVSVALSGPDLGDFQIGTNTCTVAVPVGNQCTIDVSFFPAASGAKSATLTITSNSVPASNTVPLTGTGAQSASTVTPTTIAFASQRVNTTSALQQVTVLNSGTGQMQVSGVSLIGNQTSFTATSNCLEPLGAGQSCTIDVRFVPAATGALSANLQISTNTSQSPQTVALTGTGIASNVTLKNTTLSFGRIRVGSSTTKSLTIQNNGTATLNFTSFTFSGAATGDYSITQNTCAGGPIAVRGKCSITIRFAPTVTGSRTANLLLVDDAPTSPQTVLLTGDGR